jgi:hypothetical protein
MTRRANQIRLSGPVQASATAFAALALWSAPAAAQSPILSPSQFGGGATLVDFEGLSTPVTDDLASLGVEFILTNGQGAGIDPNDPLARSFGPGGTSALVNSTALLGACPCAGIQMTFANPISRVGFEVRNDPLNDVRITLFDAATGLPVGTSQVFDTNGLWSFVGLETGLTFDRVLVEAVGVGLGAIKLDNLRFESLPLCTGTAFADGFEGGSLAGWGTAGAAGVRNSNFGVQPTSGVGQALLASGAGVGAPGSPVSPSQMALLLGVSAASVDALAPGGPPVVGSAIARTLNVNAGDTLTFQWNFLTKESTPPNPGFEAFNDFGFVAIGGTAILLADTYTAGFVFSGSSFQQETGYRTFSHTFTSAGSVTLGFGVMDVEDASEAGFESALMVDCVALDAAPVANQPPTCSVDLADARDYFLEDSPGAFVVTEGETFIVPFTGTDPDGDALTAFAVLPDRAGLSPTSGDSPLISVLAFSPIAADKVSAPFTLNVTFSDPSGAMSTCDVIVSDVNLRPACDAGGGSDGVIEVESSGPEGAYVMLSGAGSDADGTAADLAFQWSGSVLLDDATVANPVGLFPIGVTLVTLTVCDGRGGSSSCDVSVIVTDNGPPEVDCTTNVAELWPPKHDMRSVKLIVTADDGGGGVQLISATLRSDEPDNAPDAGDGNTGGDVNGQNGYSSPVDVLGLLVPDPNVPGRYTAQIQLRAERSGSSDGRVYTFEVTVEDTGGNTATTSCVVVVPRNQRKKGCNF